MNVPTDEKIAKLLVENEKLKNQLVCRRCGYDNKKEKYQIDEDLIKAYYKCMLSQSLFEKTYEIMNGTYTITCQEPNRKLLSAYAGCWDRLEGSITQYAHDLLCILLIQKIERREQSGITVIYEQPVEARINFFRSVSFENIEDAIPEEYQNIPQILLSAIKGVSSAFSTLCTQLAEEALDENFWKGVGLN